MRARELGIAIGELEPGALDAITDVAGGLGATEGRVAVALLPNDVLDPLFWATIESTEEAIVNALLAAETTSGRDGRVVHRLDPELLVEVMRRYRRL